MSIRSKVRRVFDKFDATRGDQGKDAVKAVRYYARATSAEPSSVASYARTVARELEELAGELEGAR